MKVDQDIKGNGPDPIVRGGKKVATSALEALRKASISEVEVDSSQLEGAFAVADIVNTESGEIILEANNEISPAKLSGDRRSRYHQLLGVLPGARRRWTSALADVEERRHHQAG